MKQCSLCRYGLTFRRTFPGCYSGTVSVIFIQIGVSVYCSTTRFVGFLTAFYIHLNENIMASAKIKSMSVTSLRRTVICTDEGALFNSEATPGKQMRHVFKARGINDGILPPPKPGALT
jgi:hypothetical protein